MVFVSGTATFDEIPGSQIEDTNNQIIEKIVNKPKTKSIKHKSSLNKQSMNSMRKKIAGQSKKKPRKKSGRLRVSGYRGKTFVYGELVLLNNGKYEGYIYHPKNSQTYVYGEKIKGRINLYDTSGNLYQMAN